LKLEELINHSSQNSTSNSPKINYIPWIIGSVSLIALLGIIVVIVRTQQKNPKIK
jgi:hypothetical protein